MALSRSLVRIGLFSFLFLSASFVSSQPVLAVSDSMVAEFQRDDWESRVLTDQGVARFSGGLTSRSSSAWSTTPA